MTLWHRWRQLWAELGGEGPADSAFAELASHYAEPHRAYHTLNHVAECLTELDQFADALAPGEFRLLEAALWFHDVIYDPGSQSNEQASADLAAARLRMLPEEDRKTVERLILATTHATEPGDRLERMICGVDLAILGKSHARYKAYANAIRYEYAAVPEHEYRAGRRAILERLVARTSLYVEAKLAGQYDAQARRNLRTEMAELAEAETVISPETSNRVQD